MSNRAFSWEYNFQAYSRASRMVRSKSDVERSSVNMSLGKGWYWQEIRLDILKVWMKFQPSHWTWFDRYNEIDTMILRVNSNSSWTISCQTYQVLYTRNCRNAKFSTIRNPMAFLPQIVPSQVQESLTWSVPTIHKNKYGIFSYVSMHVVMSAYQYVSYHGRIYWELLDNLMDIFITVAMPVYWWAL